MASVREGIGAAPRPPTAAAANPQVDPKLFGNEIMAMVNGEGYSAADIKEKTKKFLESLEKPPSRSAPEGVGMEVSESDTHISSKAPPDASKFAQAVSSARETLSSLPRLLEERLTSSKGAAASSSFAPVIGSRTRSRSADETRSSPYSGAGRSNG